MIHLKPQNCYGVTIEQLDRKYLDEIGKRFEEGHTNSAVVTYLSNNGININRFKVGKYRIKKYPHTLSEKVKKQMRNSIKRKKYGGNDLYNEVRQHIIKKLDDVKKIIISEKYYKINSLLSVANTSPIRWGKDRYFINFSNNIKQKKDIKEMVDTLILLKNK